MTQPEGLYSVKYPSYTRGNTLEQVVFHKRAPTPSEKKVLMKTVPKINMKSLMFSYGSFSPVEERKRSVTSQN